MTVPLIGQIKSALETLNPGAVRDAATRPIAVGVLAADDDCVDAVLEFLKPSDRNTANTRVVRITREEDFDAVDVGFSEYGIPHPGHFFTFDPADPQSSALALVQASEGHWFALGRSFGGFRSIVSERLIWKVAKENTLFSVTTSLPNIVPASLLLPWIAGEFASDTMFITANQIRLSFMLAAVHGHEVGFDSQSIKIGSIMGAALGWRAIARQVVSKVPAGIGLVPKGLIAFAGTYAVGRGLEHWFREGTALDVAARRRHFAHAREAGREEVEHIVRTALSSSSPAAGPA